MAELWDFGNQKWTRDAGTGRFQVDSYAGLGPPSSEWLPADLGRLVGARSGAAGEIFPPEFLRSPLTGSALPSPAAPELLTWLPPFGEKDTSALATIGWMGLPRTRRRLVLDLNRYPPDDPRNRGDVGLAPADLLPLPGAGSYFFIAEPFRCLSATLLAIEYSGGLLFAWTPAARRWVELKAKGAALPECSLPRELWGVQLLGAQNAAPTLALPTDSGLALVCIDILALTYSVELLEGRCVGAPLLIGESVAIPVIAVDDALQLVLVNRTNPADRRRAAIAPNPLQAGCRFNKAFADRRVAVWLSQAGQLLYRPAEAVERNRILILLWPDGVEPCFDFGAPYLSSTGRLWLLTRNAGTSAYEYLQLGQSIPERQPVRSPKLSTGGTVFHLETQLRGEPWLDQEIDDTRAAELLIPLLESVPSRSVLRARVEGVGGMSTAAVLGSSDRYRVVFELDGVREAHGGAKKDPQLSTARFHVTQLSQPWLTQAVLQAGRLYLYHPGISSGIPGWDLQR